MNTFMHSVLASVAVCSATVAMAVPMTASFSYQGSLSNADGPYTGTQSMSFALWDDVTGGAWLEDVDVLDVEVVNGVFNVDLPFDLSHFSTGEARYLEISVGATTFSPRQRLAAAPFALYALSGNEGPQGEQGEPGADGVDGAQGSTGPAGPTGPTGPQGDTGAQGAQGDTGAQGSQGATGATGPQGPQGEAGPTGPEGPAGEDGDSSWTINGSAIGYNGAVGIMTTDPSHALHIAGIQNYLLIGDLANANVLAGVSDGFFGTAGFVAIDGLDNERHATLSTLGGGMLILDGADGGGNMTHWALPTGSTSGWTAPDGGGLNVQSLEGGEGYLRVLDTNSVERLRIGTNDDARPFFEARDTAAQERVFMGQWNSSSSLGWGMRIKDESGQTMVSQGTESGGAGPHGYMYLYNTAGEIVIELDADYSGMGRIICDEVQITSGADLCERFDVRTQPGVSVEAGDVVSIDPTIVGGLRMATMAVDRAVVGVISGAGGIRPGLSLGQTGTVADGRHPVALTGRVWVKCDASRAPITPGDLLTTSSMAGHAMSASGLADTRGAVIGKAMSSLDAGQGLVLMLIQPQ